MAREEGKGSGVSRQLSVSISVFVALTYYSWISYDTIYAGMLNAKF